MTDRNHFGTVLISQFLSKLKLTSNFLSNFLMSPRSNWATFAISSETKLFFIANIAAFSIVFSHAGYNIFTFCIISRSSDLKFLRLSLKRVIFGSAGSFFSHMSLYLSKIFLNSTQIEWLSYSVPKTYWYNFLIQSFWQNFRKESAWSCPYIPFL